MNKRLMWALILICVTVIILLFNQDKAEINLLLTEIKTLKSLLFLAFTVIGVIIGFLVR